MAPSTAMVRSACNATKLEAEAAVWCAAGVATRSCCAALDVEHGCLYSAVSNASSVLLTLYATCGRARIVTACESPAGMSTKLVYLLPPSLSWTIFRYVFGIHLPP